MGRLDEARRAAFDNRRRPCNDQGRAVQLRPRELPGKAGQRDVLLTGAHEDRPQDRGRSNG